MCSVGLFCVVAACLVQGQRIIAHNNIVHDSSATETSAEVLRILTNRGENDFFLEDATETEPSIWSELLQNMTVSLPVTARTAKATYGGMPPNYNPYRRIGEAPLRNENNLNSFAPLRQAPLNFGNRLLSPGEVSETDLYLLSAIEKLVYRVDYLEKRQQKTDKLVLHLLNQVNSQQQQQQHQTQQSTTAAIAQQTTQVGPKPTKSSAKPHKTTGATTPATPAQKPSNCPADFTRIASSCYHIENQTPTDWQTANLRCKSHGGRLAEFEQAKNLKEVKHYLVEVMANDNVQLWLGALNPGLLWIWSSSAKPVDTFNATDAVATSIQSIKKNSEIAGNGRCLNLMSNNRSQSTMQLQYFGEDCSKQHGYLCELHDRTVENTISRVLRALHLD